MSRGRLSRRVATVAMALLATACARSAPPALLVNESASLPRGVYRLTNAPPSKGVVVALRPPPVARAYLAQLGAGPDARLMKRIAAIEGEVVCRRGALLTWPRGAVRVLARDRRGRPLPQWNGCGPLRPGEVLLLGETPLSFDSRYLGPVSLHDIEGTYQEAWRW